MLARAKVVSCPDPMTGMKRSAQIKAPTGVSLARLGKPSRDGFSNLAKKKLPKKSAVQDFSEKVRIQKGVSKPLVFMQKREPRTEKKSQKKELFIFPKSSRTLYLAD